MERKGIKITVADMKDGTVDITERFYCKPQPIPLTPPAVAHAANKLNAKGWRSIMYTLWFIVGWLMRMAWVAVTN